MKETDRIEYKRQLTKDLDLEKEVIAFLNGNEGGVIYFGIDKNGLIVGVSDLDSDMLKIKDRIKNKISPSCLGLFEVSAKIEDRKDIIKVNIASGSEKPYFKKKYGLTEKGCFMRIGSAVESMPQKMIEELFAKRTRNSIGKIRSTKQNLFFEQLKIYYEGVDLPLNNRFANTLDLKDENGTYNYAAYLLADTNSISIKVAKYAGADKSDLIENEEYGFCSLIKATNRVLDKLDIENKTFTKITGNARRLERQMIDRTALREALINAIIHNDYTREIAPVVEIYSNKLSITSYGGLVEGLSLEEFFEGRSMPRNRELMRVFRDLKFVEQLGSGIHRILSKYDKSIYKISDNFVEISFPFNEEYDEKLSGQILGSPDENYDLSERIRKEFGKNIAETFNVLSKHPEYTAKQIANKTNKTARSIENYLRKLKEAGIIERRGPKLGGYWEIIKTK